MSDYVNKIKLKTQEVYNIQDLRIPPLEVNGQKHVLTISDGTFIWSDMAGSTHIEHRAGTPIIENYVPATFESEGSYDEVTYCRVCETEMERTHTVIPHLEHSWSDWHMNDIKHWRTCTDEGYENLKKDEANHTMETVTVSPTFEEGGYDKHFCSICLHEWRDNYTLPLTHTYSTTWSSNSESHWHACLDEGYEDLKQDEQPHVLVENGIVNPTYTENGYIAGICESCGYETKIREIPASALIFEDFDFEEDNDEYVVKAYKGQSSEVTIPPQCNNKPITKIGCNAFKNNVNISKVSLSNNIKEIEREAFSGCIFLQTINLSNITVLGESVFKDCISLLEAEVQNVPILSNGLFENCIALKTITTCQNISEIGENTFKGCTSLKVLWIGEASIIGANAYQNCPSLIILTSRSYRPSGWSAERNCNTLAEVFEIVNPTSIKSGEYEYYLYKDGSIFLMDIQTSNTDIVLPSTIDNKSVKTCAFTLTNSFINLPAYTEKTITSFEIGPTGYSNFRVPSFEDFNNLISLKLQSSQLTNYQNSSQKFNFYNCKSLTHVEIALPTYTNNVTAGMFKGCQNLKTLKFINQIGSRLGEFFGSVEYEGSYRVSQRYSNGATAYSTGYIPETLDTVIISSGTIPAGALMSCTSIKNLVLEEGVQEIKYYGLYGCTNIDTLRLPASLHSPHETCAITCCAQTAFIVDENNSELSSQDGLLYTKNKETLLAVPTEISSLPLLPPETKEIFAHAIYRNNRIRILDFSESNLEKLLYSDAIESCENLIQVILPPSLQSISSFCIYYCYKLAEVVNLSSIDVSAIANNNSSIKEIVSSKDDSKIDIVDDFICYTDTEHRYLLDYSGSPNDSDNDIVIPTGVTFIDKKAFKGIQAHSIIIPNTVNILGKYCFSDASASLTIPPSVTEIKRSAFNGWKGNDLFIPQSVTVLEDQDYSWNTGRILFCEAPELPSTYSGNQNSGTYMVFNVASTAITTEGKYTYIIRKDNSVYLLKIDNDNITGEVYIPSEVEGHPVIGIFPTTITTLNEYQNKYITSLDFGEGIKYLGTRTFVPLNEFDMLHYLRIPEGVQYAGGGFTAPSSLYSVVLPSTLKSFSNDVSPFSNSYRLTEVINLSSLVVQPGVSNNENGQAGRYALSVVTSGPSHIVTDEQGFVTFEKDGDIWLVDYIGNDTEITIPSTITKIKGYAFYEKSNLTKIHLPNSITYIGVRAFGYCSSLIELTIPNSVIEIGNEAFMWDTNLKYVYIPSSVTTIGSYIFTGSSHSGILPIAACEASSAPETWPSNYSGGYAEFIFGATSEGIKEKSGYSYITLQNGKLVLVDINSQNAVVVIPEEIDNTSVYAMIPNVIRNLEAFKNKAMISLSIPESIIYKGYIPRFENFDLLESIDIPGSATDIGYYTNCAKLKTINIREGMTSIRGSFNNCPSLENVVFPSSVTTLGVTESYYGPSGALFKNCPALTSIVLPSHLTVLSYASLYGCNKITSLILPATLTTICNYALDACSSLTDINYQSTMADWSQISLQNKWRSTDSAFTVIHCTDGDVQIQ